MQGGHAHYRKRETNGTSSRDYLKTGCEGTSHFPLLSDTYRRSFKASKPSHFDRIELNTVYPPEAGDRMVSSQYMVLDRMYTERAKPRQAWGQAACAHMRARALSLSPVVQDRAAKVVRSSLYRTHAQLAQPRCEIVHSHHEGVGQKTFFPRDYFARDEKTIAQRVV